MSLAVATTTSRTQPQTADFPKMIGPEEAHPLILESWCRESSSDKTGWDRHNPAWGQSAATACVVQELCGGEIVWCDVTAEGRTYRHFSNRFSVEKGKNPAAVLDVDFTSLQYPNGTAISETKHAHIPEDRQTYVVGKKGNTPPEPLDEKIKTLRDFILADAAIRDQYLALGGNVTDLQHARRAEAPKFSDEY